MELAAAQIYESGNAKISSQVRPNERKHLKRMISKMEFGEFPKYCVQTPNPPSGEAQAKLIAYWYPFAFDKHSSVGSLGNSLSPINLPSPESLQCP